MIGFCTKRNLQACLKCAEKRSPEEKVGVVCKNNGNLDIIEYSELDVDLMNQRNEDGSLYLQLGNLLMFMLSSEMLINLCKKASSLNKLYHKAFKKLEYWDPEQGKSVKPDSENGYKFELFIHSLLQFVPENRFLALKVDRLEEFAPVKNANAPDGEEEVKDSPQQARRLMTELHRKWAKQVCEKNEIECGWFDDLGIEIDVLLSYQGEGDKFERIVQNLPHPGDSEVDDLYIE